MYAFKSSKVSNLTKLARSLLSSVSHVNSIDGGR